MLYDDQRDALLRADWIMVGGPTPDGRYMVLASQEITDVHLQHELKIRLNSYTYEPLRSSFGKTVMTFSAKILSYVIVVGDSYLDALQRLTAQWTPPMTSQGEITE